MPTDEKKEIHGPADLPVEPPGEVSDPSKNPESALDPALKPVVEPRAIPEPQVVAEPVPDEAGKPELESDEESVDASEARLLPVEHLEKEHKEKPLACEERLQEIFMTEERVGVERALELCGGLPGIHSCILAKGSLVVAAHNAPANLDLVSLTANATALLDAVRASSMKMGLGEIPAVTIHSEKGPVSFFHADDLAMLVLHADRGFVPGVRERLHDVITALGRAKLPLPIEGSPQ